MKRIASIILLLSSLSLFALGTAQEMALYCSGQKLPLGDRLNTVKMMIPVVETGSNSILFSRSIDDMIRFSFKDIDKTSFGGDVKSLYTASFNRYDFFNAKVVEYLLTGETQKSGDEDFGLDKIYEVFSFQQSIEVYHQDGSDINIIEIVKDPRQRYGFKMMLDGEIYGDYSGDYAVSCYLGTYF